MKINIRRAALIVSALAFALCLAACKDKAPEETTAEVTEAPEQTIETVVDEYGILQHEYCYEGDELKYSVDYLYDEKTGTVSKIMFEGKKDEEGNSILIQSERYEVNELGNLKYYCMKDSRNQLITETKKSYHGDLSTVWTETVINYDGRGSFTAEKKVYDKDGRLTDLYTYEGNEEKSHTVYTYDKDGNRIEAAQ